MTFQTLATSIAAGTPQDGSSLANSRHSTAHNYMHGVFNTVLPGGQPVGTGIPTGGPTAGDVLNIAHGSQGSPILTQGATVFVSRDMNSSVGGDINAAIWAVNRNAGTIQPVGVESWALGGASTINNVAFYGVAKNSCVGGGSISTFVWSEADVAGAGAIGIQTEINNNSGVSVPYNSLQPMFVGIDNVYDANGTGNYGSVGYLLRVAQPGIDRWDAGFYAVGDCVRTSTYIDASSAATSITITGSHASAGIAITNNNGQYMQRWIRTSATAAQYGLAVLPSGALVIDDTANAHDLVLLNQGTPGANNTCLSLLQGATPTLSQIKYFNDGSGHNVLYF